MNIVVRDLSYCFTGGDKLFHNLSFELPVGNLTALIGPSGAGKTTLLRLMCGLERIQTGTVKYPSHHLLSDRSELAPKDLGVSFVYQDYGLFNHLSVLENIVLQSLGKSKDKMISESHDVVKLLELESLLDRTLDRLSGGQQQRVALARSLMSSAPYLFWDEPFSALDPKTKDRIILRVMDQIKKRKQTLFFITHDYRDILRFADHVLHLQDHQVDFSGPVSEYKDYLKTQIL